MPPHWPHAAASSVSPSAPDRHEFPNLGCSAMTWTPIASAHTPLEWLPNPASPWRPGPPRRTPKTTGSHPGGGWGGPRGGTFTRGPPRRRRLGTTWPCAIPCNHRATPIKPQPHLPQQEAKSALQWHVYPSGPTGQRRRRERAGPVPAAIRSVVIRNEVATAPNMAVGAPGELPTTWTTAPSINLRRHGPQGPLSPSGRPLRHAPGRRATSHRSGTSWFASAAALTRRIRRPIP